MSTHQTICATTESAGTGRVGPVTDGRRTAVAPTRVLSVGDTGTLDRPDRVVTEEPMQIRVASPGREAEPLVVTLRTPGADFELAVGFLLAEGLVRSRDDVMSVAYCVEESDEQNYNVVTVTLRSPVDLDGHRRPFASTAACGICGKRDVDDLDDLDDSCPPVAEGPVIAPGVVRSLPERIRGGQGVFDSTGGLHAAARFDRFGELLALREDIGRHNALDKLFGHALLAEELPLSDQIVMLSGRMGFELVQKAAMAGVSVLTAVSAPSSLALDAARHCGITVVGFLRDGRFNIYTGRQRIDTESDG